MLLNLSEYDSIDRIGFRILPDYEKEKVIHNCLRQYIREKQIQVSKWSKQDYLKFIIYFTDKLNLNS